MRNRRFAVLLALAAAAVTALVLRTPSLAQPAGDAASDRAADGPSRLAIVWTSGDPDVAHRMALMYAGAAQRNGWFNEVRLVVWGPSQRLVVADKDIRASIDGLRDAGVTVVACLACADSYGIADDLRGMGLEVKYMGRPLTDFLRSDEWAVMTY